ncbi:MAG: NAD(P)H-dependent oxidoreductase [Lachnospiraceae bacterium]|nr:NAD(P)H-dependent oxidoreductase [Lachnospiraceae bacterium]
MARVLLIVGSMRKDSFNRQMAGEIEKLLGDRAEVSYLDFSDMPYMNQDIEYPAPEAVARVRAEVQEADGIWICSPEYNSNIPGVLKNLLDWLSRPLSPGDFAGPTAAAGKTVTISGAAGKSGASGVRASLAKLLEMMRMNLIGGEGTGIALGFEAFMTGKYEFTEEDIAKLGKQADEFIAALGK